MGSLFKKKTKASSYLSDESIVFIRQTIICDFLIFYEDEKVVKNNIVASHKYNV